MAHALQLDYFLQQDYEDFFGAYYVKWQQEAEKERRSVGEEGDELLRNYAFLTLSLSLLRRVIV